MGKKVTVNFNDKWHKVFLRNAKLNIAPTDTGVAIELLNLYRKAVTNLAENVETIPFELAKLEGVRLDPQEEKYMFEIPEDEFQLLNVAITYSIPLVRTEKEKKRLRKLSENMLSNSENGERFFSLLLIKLGLNATYANATISFDVAKETLGQFVKENSFINEKNSNRARNIKRFVLRKLKQENILSKENKKALLFYINEQYSEYKHLGDKQLIAALFSDCLKKVDEFSPYKKMTIHE